MLRKLSLAGVSAVCFFHVQAQDSTKSLTISGSIDAYYRYNFAGKVNNFTSFTNSQSSFELGMASIKAEATAMDGKVGATIDLGYGRRAEEFSYNDGNDNAGTGAVKNGFLSLSTIKQAFVTYSPNAKLKFTAGKFGTHVGYELLDAPLNRNYSMSYMFTNGPFFHQGLKADYTVGKFGFMLGLTNYVDQSTATTDVKTVIAQVSATSGNGKLKAYVNYVGFGGSNKGENPSGQKAISQFDAVFLATVTDKFNIGYNGTIQSRKPITGTNGTWFGNALYLNFDPSATLGITLRSEYISDEKTIYFGTKNIFANTVSLNAKVGPLTLIPEIRYETAQAGIFEKKDGSATKSTTSAVMAVMYKF